MTGKFVQCIIIRGDLASSLAWPAGALIAQACHASSAMNNIYRHSDEIKEVFQDKKEASVAVFEVNGQKTLMSVSDVLNKQQLQHKLWKEQPDNFETCISVKIVAEAALRDFGDMLETNKIAFRKVV